MYMADASTMNTMLIHPGPRGLRQFGEVHVENHRHVDRHHESAHERGDEQEVEARDVVAAEEPDAEHADDHGRANEYEVPLFELQPPSELEVGVQKVGEDAAAAIHPA